VKASFILRIFFYRSEAIQAERLMEAVGAPPFIMLEKHCCGWYLMSIIV
jgi:hypothetical protein